MLVRVPAEILQLIREAKCLHRLQITIPEAAKMVMLLSSAMCTHALGVCNVPAAMVSRTVPGKTTPMIRPEVVNIHMKMSEMTTDEVMDGK